jgi:hypothetical protein
MSDRTYCNSPDGPPPMLHHAPAQEDTNFMDRRLSTSRN